MSGAEESGKEGTADGSGVGDDMVAGQAGVKQPDATGG